MVHAKGRVASRLAQWIIRTVERVIRRRCRSAPVVPVDWVESVNDNAVYLNKTQDEFSGGNEPKAWLVKFRNISKWTEQVQPVVCSVKSFPSQLVFQT